MTSESQLPPINETTSKDNTWMELPLVPEGRHVVSKSFLLPGPVYLPGVDTIRNPILGTMLQYTRYQTPKSRVRTNYHKTVHQGSMFEDTGHRRSYYCIHPDWTSESSSARRVAAQNRGPGSWDSRPAFQPLTDYVIPRLERRRGHEDKLKVALSSARSSRQRQQPQSHGSVFVGSQTAREPATQRFLPAVSEKSRPPSAMNGSHFYKNLLATELLAPKREATCPNLIKY